MVFVLWVFVYFGKMILYIKSIVSDRCKSAVRNELKKLNIAFFKVELSEIEISEITPKEKIIALSIALQKIGFSILNNKKHILIERIKRTVIEMIHYSDTLPQINFSTHLSSTLCYNYTYLANVFSEIEGITIAQFIIKHKIEKVKQLISLGELNLTEIAYKLNYSSVAHLSNQFKKITGLTPSGFKQLKLKKQHPLEKI